MVRHKKRALKVLTAFKKLSNPPAISGIIVASLANPKYLIEYFSRFIEVISQKSKKNRLFRGLV